MKPMMKCKTCSAEVRDDQRFCGECGTALEKKCASCGALAPPLAKFCGMCGVPFAGQPPAPPLASSRPSQPTVGEGERRQLTVLFADVVGSTTLSGRLDPEALRALLLAYQRVCVECVERYGGNVHQYAGDGVLAYFGYPQAHDNDAERAVLAGLAIVKGVQVLTEEMRRRAEPEIAVRIGIHTGMVVVGEMGAGDVREVHAIGETPNIASRVQGEAAINSVCVSAATFRLLNRRFETRSMGTRALKGVAKETELFAVDAVHAPDESEGARQTVPLIGRDKELAHLEERWSLVCRGQGQAVLVSGQGGIGKSHLLSAFHERIGCEASAWRNIYCSPFYQNSALYPMIDLIERAMVGRDGGEVPVDRADALKHAMADAGLADEMTFALIASLLDLGKPNEAVLQNLSPDQRKRRTLDALIAWFHAQARKQALVVLVEDLHWMDASTRDLIGMLLERIADMPILLVLTFRPEFTPAWELREHASILPLARLTAEQSATVARGIIGTTQLPPDIVEQLVQRTDGVPLFVEELTRAIVEAQVAADGSDPLLRTAAGAAALEVPATLRDSLTARLDRLGEAKQVAQLASVLGREFSYAILHAICELPQAELEHKLAALNRAEIIQQRGIPPRSDYVFKHALVQEAAYDTLLKSTRAQYHRRAAEAYAETFPETTQAHPELLAHHFSRAQMPAQAIDYWQRAGEIAVSRSGYSEAISHLGMALEQLALLPESTERTQTELALRVKMGPALMALKGMGAADSAANYERACLLAQSLGDSAEGFMAMWGDWLSKNASGRIHEAAQRSEDLVTLSRRLDHEEFALQAHHSRWTNYFGLGDARISRADTLAGLSLYDPERHRRHRHIFGGHDPGVCACGTGANAAWLTGYSEEAVQLADQAVALGESLEHPFSHVLGLWWSTMAVYSVRDYESAQARAEALLTYADQYGFRQWQGTGLVIAGACRMFKGETDAGLKLLEQGLVNRQSGPQSWMGWVCSCAASAHMHCGHFDRAQELLAAAVEHAARTGSELFLPEVNRLQAEVLLQRGQIDATQAIARIETAAALARRQGALALEWRASMSLGRLHAGEGRHDQARQLLADNYAAFTEGFSSPDLVEGKGLLDSMR